MPVIRDRALIEVGQYYRNVRTGVMVEIMDVDLSGTCRVLDIRAPIDTEPTQLTEPQISSALWERVQRTAPS
jgi:hypothetical protein